MPLHSLQKINWNAIDENPSKFLYIFIIRFGLGNSINTYSTLKIMLFSRNGGFLTLMCIHRICHTKSRTKFERVCCLNYKGYLVVEKVVLDVDIKAF